MGRPVDCHRVKSIDGFFNRFRVVMGKPEVVPLCRPAVVGRAVASKADPIPDAVCRACHSLGKFVVIGPVEDSFDLDGLFQRSTPARELVAQVRFERTFSTL